MPILHKKGKRGLLLCSAFMIAQKNAHRRREERELRVMRSAICLGDRGVSYSILEGGAERASWELRE